MAKDYYKILGIEKNTTPEDIKKAFRKLAVKYHPDKNPGNKQAEEKFKEINEANDVLSDPAKKIKYDQFGENWNDYQGPTRSNPYSKARSPNSGNPDFTGYFGGDDYSDVFENIFGNNNRRKGRGASTFNGDDLRAEMTISLEEAFTGTTHTFNIANQNLSIRLKPGIREGQVLKLKGKGASGANGGGSGDLYLEIRIKKHDRFDRKEDDIYAQLPISLYNAVLGGKEEVTTLGTTIVVDIPEGSQNDKFLRLRGKGMPKYNQPDSFGDLYLTIKVIIPTKLSDKEKSLFQQLATLAETAG